MTSTSDTTIVRAVRKGTVISQRARHAHDFGLVLRTSAVFWFRQAPSFRTTVSFLDYWKIKRGIDVTIVASMRDLDGGLVQREQLEFGLGQVVNYSPSPAAYDAFEGSLEIEVFSHQDMVIPFPATMAVYESSRGISQVHSYGRTYSRHEVEEGRTVDQGEETGWTLRDSHRVRSFCVFHNGPRPQPAQNVLLEVKRYDGGVRAVEIPLCGLAPFATVKLYPADHVPDLAAFLDGQAGNVRLGFQVQEAFTRMLVGNEAVDGSDLQVTHSNFNYAVHETDFVTDHGDGRQAEAYMLVPELELEGEGVSREVIIYPDMSPGRYRVDGGPEGGAQPVDFDTGLILPVDDGPQLLRFRRTDGPLPTRLVTGLVLSPSPSKNLLPAECSLGVTNHCKPRKHFWWGLCAADASRSSRLVVHAADYVFGEMPTAETMTFRLYSAACRGFLEAHVPATGLQQLARGVSIEELFPGALEHLQGGFGWFTLFSEYGGLMAYSLLNNEAGSVTLEHCF